MATTASSLSCASAPILHAQGADLSWACQYLDDDDAPIDLAGYEIAAQIRTEGGALVGALAALITDAAAGQFELSADAADTLDWPAGTHWLDIRYTTAGQRRYTERARVRVTRTETRDPA